MMILINPNLPFKKPLKSEEEAYAYQGSAGYYNDTLWITLRDKTVQEAAEIIFADNALNRIEYRHGNTVEIYEGFHEVRSMARINYGTDILLLGGTQRTEEVQDDVPET